MHENCLMGLCDWIILCIFAVCFGTLFWTKTSGLFIQSIGFQRVTQYALRDYLPLKQGLRLCGSLHKIPSLFRDERLKPVIKDGTMVASLIDNHIEFAMLCSQSKQGFLVSNFHTEYFQIEGWDYPNPPKPKGGQWVAILRFYKYNNF